MKHAISFYSKILTGLLGLLGFTYSCLPKPEYGMPPEYHINGKVTDKVTGQPIKNIWVASEPFGIPKYGGPDTDWSPTFSTYTDENGDYSVYAYEFPPQIFFNDIDEAENGLYNDTVVSIERYHNILMNVELTPKN
ncbi:MAG: radical SAM-associated putative lipoprotein [Prevotellaceae bacterium]|jgi:putative lipoprotein (rSAM/lipoprotein system)|nr:radical SAM-associated putative lipoprotein [Prevotellaceae bacterium]